MKILVAFVLCLASTFTVMAQTEMSDESTTTKGWTLISFHRVWTPQLNGIPNGGFGANVFFTSNASRTAWGGATVTFSGIGQRYAMLIGAGPGLWLAGTGRLGLFSYLMTGVNLSSNSSITGFNFLSDPSLTVGWGSQLGIGACAEIFHNVRLHVTGMAMYLTNEHGATPVGIQAGLVLGGR